MSLFDDDNYRWRETYLLFFKQSKRPTVDAVEQALANQPQAFDLQAVRGDDRGLLESITAIAPDRRSAIDICFVAPEDAAGQIESMRDEMDVTAVDDDDADKVQRLREFDALLELMHFECAAGDMTSDDDDEVDAFFDPTALLIVVETLCQLCDGVAIDPASATVV